MASSAGMMAVVVMVAATLLAKVASGLSNVAGTVHQKNASASILPKTVFSSKLRMVLAVGLEGAGHDYMLQVDDDLFSRNRDLVRMSGTTRSMVNYHVDSSMGSTVRHYDQALALARTEMRKVAQRAADLPLPGTVMIIHGRYSYPDGGGQNKALMYVDLRLLAEVAEEAGVDFRVMYLRRPVKDIIVANTVHRRLQDAIGSSRKPEQRFMEYMQIMITDIAVMHSFLAELDPAFIVCHDFEHVGEVKQSSSIADFLAPNAAVAEPLKESLIGMARVHGASTDRLPYKGTDVVAKRLQRKFDVFERKLCSSKH